MPNQKKLEKKEELQKLITDKKNFVLVKFESTPHKRLEDLRKILRKKTARFTVIKNTLFEKALEALIEVNQSLKSIKEKFLPLKQKSALITFDGDWVEGLSAFYQFAKEEKSLSFKFGFLDDVVYEPASLLRLSTLPSKQELLAKIIGSLKSPSSRLVYSLKFSPLRLVTLISRIGKKKGGEQNG
jgi:large subunit ribosomal protein L10